MYRLSFAGFGYSVEYDTTFLNPNFNPDYQYIWSPANTLDDPNSPNPQASPTETTIYSAIIRQIAADTCELIRTVRVVVPDSINLFATPDTSTCGYPVQLSANGDVNLSFVWENSAGVVIGNGSSVTVSPQDADTYTVFVTDDYNCFQEQSIYVVNHQVDISTSDDKLACENLGTSIEVLNLDADDTLSYNWTPSGKIISGQGTAQPIVSTDNLGINIYFVEAINQYGCRDTGSVTINVANFQPVLEDEEYIFYSNY